MQRHRQQRQQQQQRNRISGGYSVIVVRLVQTVLLGFVVVLNEQQVYSSNRNGGQAVAWSLDDDELTEPRLTITGILGGRVGLPCNIQPNSSEDEVSLVLWYRDDSTTPIYSLDSRKTTLRNAHHSPVDWLNGRAYLQVVTTSAPHSMSALHEKGGYAANERRRSSSEARTSSSRAASLGDAAGNGGSGSNNNPGSSITTTTTTTTTTPGLSSGPISTPSLLQLNPLEKEDEALYRCRVDFKRARTRNYEVQLIVIVPPSRLTVTDHRGTILADRAVIGPYSEGEKLELKCEAHGGNPPPVVSWYRSTGSLPNTGAFFANKTREQQPQRKRHIAQPVSAAAAVSHLGQPTQLFDFESLGTKVASGPASAPHGSAGMSGSARKSAPNIVHFVIPALTREDLLTSYTCIASNDNISQPLISSVVLDIYFRPQHVWISGGPSDSTMGSSDSANLSAGVPVRFHCSSTGSRPPAVIQWFKGGERINATTMTVTAPTDPLVSTATSLSLGGSSSSKHHTSRSHLRRFRHVPSVSIGKRSSVATASLSESAAASTSWSPTTSDNWHTSTVEFVPTPEDDGKTLTCRAHNPAMPSSHHYNRASVHAGVQAGPPSHPIADSTSDNERRAQVGTQRERPVMAFSNAIQDGIKLHVQYVPQLTVRLGKKLRHSHIREGSDVFLECDVKANPSIIEMGWRFEGHELTPASENIHGQKGIVISEHSLVLQNVTRRSRGRYTCIGTNAAGQGESHPFQLRVRYEPRCVPGQRTVYGAAKNEAVKLSCVLEADPEEVVFKWKTRNSKGVISSFSSSSTLTSLSTSSPNGVFDEDQLLSESSGVPGQHGVVHSDGTRSWLTLIPRAEEDYVTIFCWGRNSVGTQKKPCVFTLIPAGPPGPVHNCTVTKASEESLTISCLEGYDGGTESGQHFHMEVHDSANQNRVLIANVTSGGTPPRPTLTAAGLSPSTSYVCTVYAANERGTGQPTILVASTIPRPLSLSAKGGSLFHFLDLGRLSPTKNPIALVIALAAFISIAAVLVLIILFTRKATRASKLLKGRDHKTKKKQKDKKTEVSREKIMENDDEESVPLRDSKKEREQITDIKSFSVITEDDSKCPDVVPEATKLTMSGPEGMISSAVQSFAESSFSTSKLPPASTGGPNGASPSRGIAPPLYVHHGNAMIGNTTLRANLRSPRASLAEDYCGIVDCLPHNGIIYGDRYSSLQRGSWDLGHQKRSRNSLPSSMSYQHMASLPRMTRLAAHHDGQQPPTGTRAPSTRNVTFDMTPTTHPYAWVDGGCALTLPRGHRSAQRGPGGLQTLTGAAGYSGREGSGAGRQLNVVVGDRPPTMATQGNTSSTRVERASNRDRAELQFSRAKLQLLTLAEPQRPLLKAAILQTTASTVPTRDLMKTTTVACSPSSTAVTSSTMMSKITPTTTTTMTTTATPTRAATLCATSQLHNERAGQSPQVSTVITRPRGVHVGDGGPIRAPLVNRDEGHL